MKNCEKEIAVSCKALKERKLPNRSLAIDRSGTHFRRRENPLRPEGKNQGFIDELFPRKKLATLPKPSKQLLETGFRVWDIVPETKLIEVPLHVFSTAVVIHVLEEVFQFFPERGKPGDSFLHRRVAEKPAKEVC